jgi:hypothetical protein
MNLIPSKKQWSNWTLPSKASYAVLIVAFLFFGVQFIYSLYQDNYKKKTDKPKIIIGTQNKPYLRYEIINDNKISFSYELSFKNSSLNTAINLIHSSIAQKLVINKTPMINIISNPDASDLPPKLVTGETFYKIYELNGNNLDKNKIDDLIKKYSSEELSLILDINIEYKDEITNADLNTHEILNIFKNKVLIIN